MAVWSTIERFVDRHGAPRSSRWREARIEPARSRAPAWSSRPTAASPARSAAARWNGGARRGAGAAARRDEPRLQADDAIARARSGPMLRRPGRLTLERFGAAERDAVGRSPRRTRRPADRHVGATTGIRRARSRRRLVSCRPAIALRPMAASSSASATSRPPLSFRRRPCRPGPRAGARAAAFRLTWIDPRPGRLPAAHPANVTAIRDCDPVRLRRGGAGRRLRRGDDPQPRARPRSPIAALQARRFPYVGLIGAATKRARFERRCARRASRTTTSRAARLSDRPDGHQRTRRRRRLRPRSPRRC